MKRQLPVLSNSEIIIEISKIKKEIRKLKKLLGKDHFIVIDSLIDNLIDELIYRTIRNTAE